MARDEGAGPAVESDELCALRAENDALRAGNASLMAAVDVIDDAVFIKGEDGRYRMINAAGSRLLGKSAARVIGGDDTELFESETARRIMEDDRKMIAEGTTSTFEEVATSSGITRTYLVTKGPLRDNRGRVVGVVGISRHITAWRRDEAALREARQCSSIPAGLESVQDGVAEPVNGSDRVGRRPLPIGPRPPEVAGHRLRNPPAVLGPVLEVRQARRFVVSPWGARKNPAFRGAFEQAGELGFEGSYHTKFSSMFMLCL
jgi:PAS domain S-box-containing protein